LEICESVPCIDDPRNAEETEQLQFWKMTLMSEIIRIPKFEKRTRKVCDEYPAGLLPPSS
jgi:hypothetical protein